jgi:RND family efflux transporter MFP subunit
MKKYGRFIGAGIAMVIVVVLFLYMQGYLSSYRVPPGKLDKQKLDVGSLKTVEVKRVTMESFDTVVGTISARKSTLITAKIPAHVKKILVKPGQKVKAGELLVQLDDRDISAKLTQAKSGLESAKANFERAKNRLKRVDNLFKQQSITEAEYEAAVADERMASARVREAEAGIKELEVMIGFTAIKAPYSGIVVEKMTNTGALAGPGMPLIRMEDAGDIRLEAYVPESKRSVITIGQHLGIRIDAINKNITGVVEEIVPSTDPRTRSFLVRVSINEKDQLDTGMFGRLYLPAVERSIIVVPEEAIREAGQLKMVRIVENGQLVTRMIRLGSRVDNGFEVLSGLSEGETIVLDPESVEVHS